MNKVTFLKGLTKILDKFDKRSLVRKILPLMLRQMKHDKLVLLVLPSLINILKQEDTVSKEDFKAYIWWAVQGVCQLKQIPAQGLVLLISHSELFYDFIDAGSFQDVFLPLILKSLQCPVAKLQILAMQKIPFLAKKIEYMSFKSKILPLLMHVVETDDNPPLRLKGLEILILILPSLDQNFLRDSVVITLDKVRQGNNDTDVNMHLLTLYDKLASALTPEDIGTKVLPGLIPMLISA